MNKLPISVFLLLFQSVLMMENSDHHSYMSSTHVNCYEAYRIPLKENIRPIRDETARHIIPLARHHIIPKHVLRKFYNKLMDNERHFRHLFDEVLVAAGYNKGFNLLAIEHVNLVGKYPILEEDLTEMKPEYRQHLEDLSKPEIQADLVKALYIWMSFNIFKGPEPQVRSDDPGACFEDNADVIVGEGRLRELRLLQAEMIDYIEGRNSDPTEVINNIGHLLRISPMSYDFNHNHWRLHRNIYFKKPYAIATYHIKNNYNYRMLVQTDYCSIRGYHRQSRRHAEEEKPCLLLDEDAVYAIYCSNSLNVLRELIKNKIVTLLDNVNTANAVGNSEKKQPK